MPEIELESVAKTLDDILRSALAGEEVIITQHHQPVLKLVRVEPSAKRRVRGSAKGLIHLADDFDAPLDDFVDYMP